MSQFFHRLLVLSFPDAYLFMCWRGWWTPLRILASRVSFFSYFLSCEQLNCVDRKRPTDIFPSFSIRLTMLLHLARLLLWETLHYSSPCWRFDCVTFSHRVQFLYGAASPSHPPLLYLFCPMIRTTKFVQLSCFTQAECLCGEGVFVRVSRLKCLLHILRSTLDKESKASGPDYVWSLFRFGYQLGQLYNLVLLLSLDRCCQWSSSFGRTTLTNW